MELKKTLILSTLALLWGGEAFAAITLHCPTSKDYTQSGNTVQAPATKVAGVTLPNFTATLPINGTISSIDTGDEVLQFSASSDKTTYTFTCSINVILAQGIMHYPITVSFQTDKLTGCKRSSKDPTSVLCDQK